jgi:hypothetical protein
VVNANDERRPHRAGRPVLVDGGGATRRAVTAVQATPVGLRFPDRRLAYQEWLDAGAKVAKVVDSSAWCLGDWLAYGESQYAGRYRLAVDRVGLSYQTLRNFAWVARRFPLSRRRDKLTFYHHMEVARLSTGEQDHWLERAVGEGWSVRELRHRLQAPGGPRSAADGPAAVRRIRADQQRLDRWRVAAEQANLSLEAWIVDTLDLAAVQTLGA